jgi:endonuclease/exonuclease/phosphatase family metal-dependent hydrolase
MQQDPFLEQLDWFFTSVNWTIDYLNTLVLPMAKITSDHIPCRIAIVTSIPKATIFRFENYGLSTQD